LATVGYCVKCKAKREIKGERQIIMKNGRPATTGTCTVCGTKMFKIGGGGGAVKAKAKKAPAKKKSKGKKKK
jgi:ribosomal protein S27E